MISRYRKEKLEASEVGEAIKIEVLGWRMITLTADLKKLSSKLLTDAQSIVQVLIEIFQDAKQKRKIVHVSWYDLSVLAADGSGGHLGVEDKPLPLQERDLHRGHLQPHNLQRDVPAAH